MVLRSWDRDKRWRDFIKVIAGTAAVGPFVVAPSSNSGRSFTSGPGDDISGTEGRQLGCVQAGLLKSGYIERQNLIIEYRSGDGREERFPNLAMELARLNVDLILARATPATLAAKNAATIVPIA